MSANSSATRLKVTNLTKVYSEGLMENRVLNRASFDATSDHLSFVIGPSGSGKSTLLALIAGLARPDSGIIEINGERISEFGPRGWANFRRHHIGIVLQQFMLIPALTVRENILAPLQILGWSARKAASVVERAAENVGLGDQLDKLPRQLSAGQKQRTAIARATVHSPALLLCDEPTAALDRKSTISAMQLFRDYAARSDCAVIIVTHDTSLIHPTDAVWHIDVGKLQRRVGVLDTEYRQWA